MRLFPHLRGAAGAPAAAGASGTALAGRTIGGASDDPVPSPIVHPRQRHLLLRLTLAAANLALAGSTAAQVAASSDGGLGTSGDYIVRFVQYVRWPAEDDVGAWRICIVAARGDSASFYAERTARGKPFDARRVQANDALAGCNVLDLTAASPAESRALLERARRHSILTVGEGERFCSMGGTVCLRPSVEGGGFEINLSSAQQSRLTINAQLLMLGRKRQVAGGQP